MKFIDKIDIHYFRSLKKVSLKSINHLNIISGKNDSGKSNFLRALELFFSGNKCTFLDDYNKERLQEVRETTIKGKQIITISISFSRPNDSTTLPPKFRVTRVWDRTGSLISQTDNLESSLKRYKMNPNIDTARRRLTGFLNKFKFINVPALRDETFFSELLSILQNALFEAEGRKRKASSSQPLIDLTNNFNIEIERLTKNTNKDFKNASGIDTNINLPSNLPDLFKTLKVDTKHGGFEIPITGRGHGIKMHYIPTILNHISSIGTSYYVWGFDEPENSCEYSLANQMAKDFQNKFAKNAQIFLVSHSFSYIALRAVNITRYRVFIDNHETSSKIVLIDKKSEAELEKEMGILSLNEELKNLYKTYESKLETINEIENEIKIHKKPFLFFEGITDNKHFSIAHKQLYNMDIKTVYRLGEHVTRQDGSSIGDGATRLNNFMFEHVGKVNIKVPIIAIFDFDEKGFNEVMALVKTGQYKSFSNTFGFDHIYVNSKRSNVFIMLTVPPVFRENSCDMSTPKYCHLSTELLYENEEIPNANRSFPTKLPTEVFGFKGKKTNFYEKINTKVSLGTPVNFNGFKNTFSVIGKIVNGNT